MQNDTQQTLQIPEEIRSFLDSVLEEAHMTGFNDVMHEAMINELYIRLDKFLISKVAEYLPEEKLEEFAKLSQEGATQDIIQQYLQNNLPNAQDVFTLAFGEFKNMYLDDAGKTGNNQNQQIQI